MWSAIDTLPIPTQTLAYSLGFVVVIGMAAYVSSHMKASWQDSFTWIWLACGAMKHYIFTLLIMGSWQLSTTFGDKFTELCERLRSDMHVMSFLSFLC
ncbi:uncharacterized protein LAESUDRAFT_754590 [Laetiporus sulphureus 93-53]|uniref:Uncharacterized protein n=1 Tax=Laetiporus sulphureus 93-53 TaxID=1314785 RepID=A0A165HRD1_9APHY|nr:uncharacterized protein LAESUDRAFT_754590 [Laetiporus sulphureus 93-53]KZT12079.1 hypothetical protein LAESUDRAFT_754590 [Laetiporus sulphureus 93-53]